MRSSPCWVNFGAKIIIISRSQSLTTVRHLKERTTNHNPVSVKQLLPQSPFAFRWSDHLVRDLPVFLFPEALPRRISFSRFSTSLLATWPKYFRMRLSSKTLDLTGSCISLTSEMLVHRAVQVSGVSSTSFARPTSQRRRLFFYRPPLMSMDSHHIGKQRKQVIV